MSMDAVTSAALDNLHKDAIPKLVRSIASLQAQSPGSRQASMEIANIIQESSELLTLLANWIDFNQTVGAEQELSADEAIMLAAAGGIDEPELAQLTVNHRGETTRSIDMSDNEAHRLLAEMDAPAATASAGDMSDEEARRLLEEMDTSNTSANSTKNDMSDDEASRLLAEMDAPQAKTEAPPPNKLAPVSTDNHQPDVSEISEIAEWESNDFASDPEMMNDFSTKYYDWSRIQQIKKLSKKSLEQLIH